MFATLSKYGKKALMVAGMNKIPCAISDKVPDPMRRVFFNEDWGILQKDSTKRPFLYQIPLHDKLFSFRLLSALKVRS
jgi:hypothetical protein